MGKVRWTRRGFDPAGRSGGNGLANMRERAARIGGKLAIESPWDQSRGRGTAVRFTGSLG